MDRKELIEKARELLACGALSKEAADAIKGDFPELKESEDEMHRKWILEYLYDGLRKTDEQFKGQFKSAIAWLENQKEQKPVEWDEYTETNLDRALMIIKKAKGNLQGYQSDDGVYECDKAIECIEHILYRGINIDGLCKPAEWSEEDEVKLNDVIRLIENSGNVKSIIKHYTDFLKSLPERFNLQPKQEWSEEDEEHIQNCLRVIKMKLDEKPYPYYQDYLWLKSLRPQPKRSWTISDAKPGDILTTDTVTFIFKSIDEDGCVSMYCSYSVSTTGKDIDFSDTAYVDSKYVHPASIEQREEFLSNLWKFISRPHWKPSEEQMREELLGWLGKIRKQSIELKNEDSGYVFYGAQIAIIDEVIEKIKSL